MSLKDISPRIAEKILKRKVDKRFNFYYLDEDVCDGFEKGVYIKTVLYTCCSGCSDFGDYTSPERGGGCFECRGKGRVKQVDYVPYEIYKDIIMSKNP